VDRLGQWRLIFGDRSGAATGGDLEDGLVGGQHPCVPPGHDERRVQHVLEHGEGEGRALQGGEHPSEPDLRVFESLHGQDDRAHGVRLAQAVR
jgi:hypothetical protein